MTQLKVIRLCKLHVQDILPTLNCYGFYVCVSSSSGILRDSSGSYIASFHLLGTMALVGGLVMISLPLVERCYKTSRHTKGK